ncbi:kinase-like domain-containing protein [Xylaria digitata]|nr:kinase-like domain-containing protein [Xylaria digitata]
MAPKSPIKSRHLRTARFRNAQQAWKGLRRKFKKYEDAGLMTYRKVLGFGGFGMVQRWTLNGLDDRNVAIKTIIRAEEKNSIESLQREIWWNKRFTGSEHLVQLVDLPPEIMAEIGDNINNEECHGVPIMVMEELGLGSLYDLVHRIERTILLNPILPEDERMMEYIPNRTLWMVRACIGMAYSSSHPTSRSGQVNRETMDNIPDSVIPSRLIHSDIDIQNVFVAEPTGLEDAEHYRNPVVKIADYGCMVQWDDSWSYAKKSNSLWGKKSYKAPEQFYPDGDMDVHTNVYQIGNVMQDLITLTHVPFDARLVLPRQLMGTDVSFMTVGCRLLEDEIYQIQKDWKNVDMALRELVAGCMGEAPRMRPSLRQLEELCIFRMEELDRQAKYDSSIAQEGLGPTSNTSVPGASPANDSYRKRYPQGQTEPDSLLERFYKEYFIEPWEQGDKYSSYWADPTRMPSSSGKGSTAVPAGIPIILPGQNLPGFESPTRLPGGAPLPQVSKDSMPSSLPSNIPLDLLVFSSGESV